MSDAPSTPTYGMLKVRHPSYDADYWTVCDALYAGGKKLLGNQSLLREIFPPHNSEADRIYQERLKRAWYIPYAGQLIDFLIAGLFTDPIEVTAEPEPDAFYKDEFFEDVSKPGGEKMTFRAMVRQVLLDAFRHQNAWVLCELPVPTIDPTKASLLDQEKSGDLRAYAIPVDASSVVDWEENDAGELSWALIRDCSAKRPNLMSVRNVILEEYTLYTPDEWTRYSFSYEKDKPPKDDAGPTDTKSGKLSFGRVPLLRFCLPEGLWAMGKLEPIARAHFNLRNALSWAEYKSLFPVAVQNNGPQNPLAEITANPTRATDQVVGQGYVKVLGPEDKFQYVGPDTSGYEVAAKDLDKIRDEMHRVLHAMAQSVDNSGAALKRSAASKEVDQAATNVILGEVGQRVREYVVRIMETIAQGRNDTGDRKWQAKGFENFEEMTPEALISQATSLEMISIPSATFQRKYKYQLAKRTLGDEASPEDLDDIEKELEDAITPEQFQMGAMSAEAALNAQPGEPPEKPPMPGKQAPPPGKQAPPGGGEP